MRPVTIVYVTDMEAAIGFYGALLPQGRVITSSAFWTELSFGTTSLALHIADAVEAGSQLGLAMTADRSLEEIASDLDLAGIAIDRGIAEEPFGRSMVIRDLDGLAIQINEHRD